MTLVVSAWMRCDVCGLVVGVGPIENDDTAVDAIFDIADGEGWDVPPFGPDACASCKGTPAHVENAAEVERRVRCELEGGK